jgi:hypothetical protein
MLKTKPLSGIFMYRYRDGHFFLQSAKTLNVLSLSPVNCVLSELPLRPGFFEGFEDWQDEKQNAERKAN